MLDRIWISAYSISELATRRKGEDLTQNTPGRGRVIAVCRSEAHSFSKQPQEQINLLAGLGIEGDAHMGKTVKHRYRVAQDPTQPNLTQVHLIAGELHEHLTGIGFNVGAGVMGENITTQGIELLDLPEGARLHLGDDAIVEITGLRNPCYQLNDYQSGLMAAVLDKDADGKLIRKAGIMGIVIAGGIVRPSDAIKVALPPLPHKQLQAV